MNYHSTWWSIKLPDSWMIQESEECVTFSSGNEGDVLQFSAARRLAENVTDEDLLEFARRRLGAGIALIPASYGGFVGFEATYIREEKRWREWWLRSKNLMLYVTCQSPRESMDGSDTSNILQSLKSSLTGMTKKA